MNGWKMKLGSVLKGAGGAALGFVFTQLQNVPLDVTTKKGAGITLALFFIGDAIKNWGHAAKMEKQLEATEKTAEVVSDKP